MTMMEDFNQYTQPMTQPMAQEVLPMAQPMAQFMAQPSSFAPEGGMLGERINERMEWQSPARGQIIRNDFGLNPATLGAGFQMQGTNTPTVVTDFIATGSPQSNYQTTYAAGDTSLSGWQSGDPNPPIYSTGYSQPANNAFDMGTPIPGVLSHSISNPSNFIRYNADPNSLVTNPSFPMGGMYNYFTTANDFFGYNNPIRNYDPYNALANTGMYGYDFSQPLYPANETFNIWQMGGYNPLDPFQSYR